MSKMVRRNAACPNELCGGHWFEATVELDDAGEWVNVWECPNCCTTVPRKTRKPRQNADGLTDRQARVIEHFRSFALNRWQDHLPEDERKEYEFKGVEAGELTLSSGEVLQVKASTGFDISPGANGSVYVSATVGKVGDEGTWGSIYCRESYHFAIGPRGGLEDFTHGKSKRVTKPVKHFWELNIGR